MEPVRRSPEGRDLAPKQAALIEAICKAAEHGVELTREEAGTLAGYGKGDVARVQASRTLALPHVQQALRDRLKAMAVMEAPAAMMMLRHVRQHGRGMAQLTAGMKLLDIAGLAGGEAPTAGNIAVQVVLPADLGALLPQARPVPAQVIDHEGEMPGPRHRMEGVGRAATPPRPSSKAKAKKGGRGRKRAATSQARPPRKISAPVATASGGETDGGEGER